jgi:hypothetical protein
MSEEWMERLTPADLVFTAVPKLVDHGCGVDRDQPIYSSPPIGSELILVQYGHADLDGKRCHYPIHIEARAPDESIWGWGHPNPSTLMCRHGWSCRRGVPEYTQDEEQAMWEEWGGPDDHH